MFEVDGRLDAMAGEVGPEPDWSQVAGPGFAPDGWDGPDLDIQAVSAASSDLDIQGLSAVSCDRDEGGDGLGWPVLGVVEAAPADRSAPFRAEPDSALRPGWPRAADSSQDLDDAEWSRRDVADARGGDWSPTSDRESCAQPWDEPDPAGANPLISAWSWAEESPGAALVAALDRLSPTSLDDYDVVEAIAGWERIAAWGAARQAIAVAELSGRPVFAGPTVTADGIDPVRATALEIAARLRISHQEATYRVVVAQELTTQRQATLAALSTGEIDLRRARSIVDGVQVLDPDRAAAVEGVSDLLCKGCGLILVWG
jgi:Domain of unknown function (DUF222)